MRLYILKGPSKTTLPQLKYYWGVVVKAICGETGYTKAEIHLYNKHKFGMRTTVEIGGETVERVHGLRISKEVTQKFIEDVMRFWSEKTGIEFPTTDQLSEAQIVEAYNEPEDDYE